MLSLSITTLRTCRPTSPEPLAIHGGEVESLWIPFDPASSSLPLAMEEVALGQAGE